VTTMIKIKINMLLITIIKSDSDELTLKKTIIIIIKIIKKINSKIIMVMK
jgi:hypothetical protein